MLLTSEKIIRSFFILMWLFMSIGLFSQDTKEYSLPQLATYNYTNIDIGEYVDWPVFYPANKDGMEKLQVAIKEHPSQFPLQELEDKSKFESDAFRRWEYQMRKMPVKIVSPQANLLDVSFITENKITFCKTSSFDMIIKVKNISGFELPNFYFMIPELPGAVINYRKLQLIEGVSFVQSSNIFTFNKGLRENETAIIALNYSLGCDGRGGSPVLRGKSKITLNLNWEINLIGYLLDDKQKKLYKVIDFGDTSKTLEFNKQTKF